ncbi:MAG TPA: MBOAT family O-acyltransferase [Cytophagales bacterium]|nr:MBOAT family O-acyltransferase [Cytophagales bacterium]
MLFNSLQFLIFFPIVTTLYFLLPYKYRWILLLAASCFFYMAFIPVYILILAITIIIDYFAGIWIEESQGRKKKRWLIISIVSTCLVLFIFKYFNFFTANWDALATFFDWNYSIGALSIILPIGLSFHTFQSLSYVIEVYRGNQKAERHFGIYSLYVMFYPQLVAGPIERPQNILHQLYEKHDFDYERVKSGLLLMAWGLFKKVVIADRLAVFVNQVYNSPAEYHGFEVIIATFFFAIQIYCDFSGYSDIAIGSAKVMGYDLMKNFDRPYFSKSVSEFWKRWHISLSTWFRDYVYISMGGNRVGKWKWYYNLFITFVISGLWHGANWTFIIWGALHGFYLVFAIISAPLRENLNRILGLTRTPGLLKVLQITMTFLLVCFAWIFFRANNVSDAFLLIENMTELKLSQLSLNMFGTNYYSWIMGILFILIMEIIHLFQRTGSIRDYISQKPALIRWGLYVVFLIVLLNFGVFNNEEFIYFQF